MALAHAPHHRTSRAVLKKITEVVDAELAARRAIAELLSMDDRTLRDLGITRGEIGNLIRQRQGNVGADDEPVLSSDAGYHRPALPAISAPNLSPEGFDSADRRAKARSRA